MYQPFNFREHRQSMITLRTLLTERKKLRRRRRIFLNIHITFVAWLMEFFGGLAGALMIFLPHENRTTRGLQLITGFMYFIATPCAYLMNSSDVKSMILDNPIYLKFTNTFFPHINQIVPVNNNHNEK